MSIKLMSMIFEIKGQLTPTEKLVMLELADHANDLGEGIWPGWNKIMDRTSLTRTPVRATLAFLTEAGILETIVEPTPNSSTRRRINVALLLELVDCGDSGRLHPRLAAIRQAIAARAAEKQAEKEEGVSLKDTGGVSLEDTPEGLQKTQLCLQKTHPVSPGDTAVSLKDPESLINLLNNHQETDQEARENIPDLETAWAMVRDQLRYELTRSNYMAYVEPLRPMAVTGDDQSITYSLTAPDDYILAWASSRLERTISRLLTAIYARPAHVAFIMAPAIQSV